MIGQRKFFKDKRGATAIEFAIVSLPFMLLSLSILQFLFLHYTQSTLSDALYNSASKPEASLTTSVSKADYKNVVCAANAFTTNCNSLISLELMKLDNVPTTRTPISTTFTSGASGDALMLRAELPVLKVVGFMPTLTARESVIFRRP